VAQKTHHPEFTVRIETVISQATRSWPDDQASAYDQAMTASARVDDPFVTAATTPAAITVPATVSNSFAIFSSLPIRRYDLMTTLSRLRAEARRIADTGVCWRMGLMVVRSLHGW
jgi:hypothetical protein